MQDFAKSRSFHDAESQEPEADWSLDFGSVVFGALLGAIVMVAGSKVTKYDENQEYREQIADNISEISLTNEFEFYEVLKREDLYPPLSR